MRKILSSLACLAFCLFVWTATAPANAPRVLVLPFAINAPEATAQLASDVPALVRQAIAKHGFTAIPTSANAKAKAESDLSARNRARSAKARYIGSTTIAGLWLRGRAATTTVAGRLSTTLPRRRMMTI